MYFSVGRNVGMRALIEAIPVAPGSSRKVEQKTTGASSGLIDAWQRKVVLWATLVQGGEVDTHAECSRLFLLDHDWVCEPVRFLDLADESYVL